MAEQRFCKPQVGGSIPLASSIWLNFQPRGSEEDVVSFVASLQKGLASSAESREARFSADPATVGRFNSSRQLHNSISHRTSDYLSGTVSDRQRILLLNLQREIFERTRRPS